MKDIIKILKNNNYNIISENLYTSFCTNIDDINVIEGSIFILPKAMEEYENYKLLIKGTKEDYRKIVNLISKLADVTYDENNSLVRILPIGTDKWNGIEKILKKHKSEYKTIGVDLPEHIKVVEEEMKKRRI